MSQWRILHIIDWLHVGGAEKGLLNLIRVLDKNQYTSIVCAFEGGPLAEKIRQLNVDLEIITKRRSLDIGFLLKLARLMKREKIDLVHCRSIPATVYGGIAAKLVGLPLVVSVHGREAISYEIGIKALRWVQRLSGKIITVSESLKRDLVSAGLTAEDIVVIHNGIDINERPDPKSITVQKRDFFSINPSSPVIAAVGNLRPVKGHKYLIEAIPIVLRAFPDVKFLIIGEGELRLELEKLSEDLGVQNSIRFLGHRQDVFELMSIFDFLVLPSLSEGISNVLLEAMLMAKPVIATHVGGNPEVVENDGTGILVPPADAESLAQAIINLLGDEKRRAAMGEAGLQRVREQFSLADAIQKYEAAYDGLINR